MVTIALYFLLGLLSGFLAGLFGIGGGFILVPALYTLFSLQQLTEHYNQHLALGTSMACIFFSAIISSLRHYQHQAIRLDIIKPMGPTLFIGTLAGTGISSQLPQQQLVTIFALLALLAAMQMLINYRPAPGRQPSPARLSTAGLIIGIICSFISIGGGVLSVPYLLYYRIKIQKAIGTAAALGLPIAAGGCLGHLFFGHHVNIPGSIGQIYGYALLPVIAGSLLTVRAGADLAHRLNSIVLKRIFALMLISISIRLLWDVIP